MNGTRAVKGKGTRVFGGSVALMILQTVRGVKRGEIGHGAIAGDLGDDGCGSDGRALGVAVDDSDFQAGKAGFFIAVNEAEAGLAGESLYGTAHGEEAGTEDIVGFDFFDGGDADGPDNLGMRAEEMAEFVAMLAGDLLGVVEVTMAQAVGQNRGGGVDGTSPATATNFIHAGDDGDFRGTQFALEGPGQGQERGMRGLALLIARLGNFDIGVVTITSAGVLKSQK